jgi:hypothetical protein
MEEISIFIERHRPEEYHQVSNQVPGEEKNEDETREGDDELFADGGGPVSSEATSESIHDNKEQTALQSARAISRVGAIFKGRVALKRNPWRE